MKAVRTGNGAAQSRGPRALLSRRAIGIKSVAALAWDWRWRGGAR